MCAPHVDIDSGQGALERLAANAAPRGLAIGSLVAPVRPPAGGGSAMGSNEERQRFLTQVRKACRIARDLRQMGVRPYGVVRIDSATDPATWAADPAGNTARLVATFRDACTIAGTSESVAAEGRSAGRHPLVA